MTPLRTLTDDEREQLAQLARVATTSPVVLDRLLRELIVARAVVRIVRTQARCLPRGAREALDHLPHHRPVAREFSHD